MAACTELIFKFISRPIYVPHAQFVPSYLKSSKVRIKELREELQKMPKPFTSDAQRRDALHKVISAIKEELNNMVTGNAGLICVEETSHMDVVPRVTRMYREYKTAMMEVSLAYFFLGKLASLKHLRALYTDRLVMEWMCFHFPRGYLMSAVPQTV